MRRREPYRRRRSARGAISHAATQGRLIVPGLRIIATLLAARPAAPRPPQHRAGKRRSMRMAASAVNSPGGAKHGAELEHWPTVGPVATPQLSRLFDKWTIVRLSEKFLKQAKRL